MVAMDLAVREGPRYDETALVGCPLNAVLDYCMATPAGMRIVMERMEVGEVREVGEVGEVEPCTSPSEEVRITTREGRKT